MQIFHNGLRLYQLSLTLFGLFKVISNEVNLHFILRLFFHFRTLKKKHGKYLPLNPHLSVTKCHKCVALYISASNSTRACCVFSSRVLAVLVFRFCFLTRTVCRTALPFLGRSADVFVQFSPPQGACLSGQQRVRGRRGSAMERPLPRRWSYSRGKHRMMENGVMKRWEGWNEKVWSFERWNAENGRMEESNDWEVFANCFPDLCWYLLG